MKRDEHLRQVDHECRANATPIDAEEEEEEFRVSASIELDQYLPAVLATPLVGYYID